MLQINPPEKKSFNIFLVKILTFDVEASYFDQINMTEK